jgi:pimeloyl-ACP methyl ester carboxylesterase
LADTLADRYTVITYDRRGFSRSPLTRPLPDQQRVDADVDDARHLLEELSDGPAHVFATCSGAIVGLALLQRHRDLIRTMVVHEPPLVTVLDDADRWLTFHDELYQTYRTSGIAAAREIFRDYAGMGGETRPPPGYELAPPQLAELRARLGRNQVFWFEHELRTYPAFVPDLAALAAGVDRLRLAGGETSCEHFSCRPTTVLAARLGVEVTYFPGGHVGHVTHPIEFAAALDRVLTTATR